MGNRHDLLIHEVVLEFESKVVKDSSFEQTKEIVISGWKKTTSNNFLIQIQRQHMVTEGTVINIGQSTATVISVVLTINVGENNYEEDGLGMDKLLYDEYDRVVGIVKKVSTTSTTSTTLTVESKVGNTNFSSLYFYKWEKKQNWEKTKKQIHHNTVDAEWCIHPDEFGMETKDNNSLTLTVEGVILDVIPHNGGSRAAVRLSSGAVQMGSVRMGGDSHNNIKMIRYFTFHNCAHLMYPEKKLTNIRPNSGPTADIKTFFENYLLPKTYEELKALLAPRLGPFSILSGGDELLILRQGPFHPFQDQCIFEVMNSHQFHGSMLSGWLKTDRFAERRIQIVRVIVSELKRRLCPLTLMESPVFAGMLWDYENYENENSLQKKFETKSNYIKVFQKVRNMTTIATFNGFRDVIQMANKHSAVNWDERLKHQTDVLRMLYNEIGVDIQNLDQRPLLPPPPNTVPRGISKRKWENVQNDDGTKGRVFPTMFYLSYDMSGGKRKRTSSDQVRKQQQRVV